MLAYLIFVSLLIVLLATLTTFKTTSDVFFGIGAVLLLIVIVAWIGSKRINLDVHKDKDRTINSDTVYAYYPDLKKVTPQDIINTRRLRIKFQLSWSIISSSIAFILALSFAFV